MKTTMIPFGILATVVLLAFASVGRSASVSGSNAGNVNIPDGSPGAWVSSQITISGAPAGATVTGIDVYFRCVHTYSGDLVVDLNADVNGSLGNIHLWNREGAGADNPSRTATGISTFNGQSVNRTWYLYARDYEALSSGYIDEWTITVYYAGVTPTTYSITPNPATVDEGAGTLTFTITRSGGTPAETIYTSTTTGEGFANNSDYTGILNQAVSFTSGQVSRTVTVTINNDATTENNETFGFIVQRNTSDPVSTYLAKSTFTITDNDPLSTTYSITPNPATVDEGAGTLTFTITRSGGMPAETIYASTTTGEGFANNSDYTGILNQAVSFTSGQASRTVAVTINNDATTENNETFGFIVQRNTTEPVSTYVAKSTFTITDNDVPIIVDYPGASWIAAGPGHFTTASRGQADVTSIVIHTTEDAFYGAAIAWFQNPAGDTSAHYLVQRNGSVVQLVRETDIAHHAGVWLWNQHSIGIEVERLANATELIESAQYSSVKSLVSSIRTRFNVPLVFPASGPLASPTVIVDGIVGHGKVVANGVDPVNWDWAHFQQLFGLPLTRTLSVSPLSLSFSSSPRSVVDLQVFYTPAANAEAGGEANLLSEIAAAVKQSNQAYVNSLVNHRLRLLSIEPINYVEAAGIGTDIVRLITKSDGDLDSVHSLRDQVGADVVALIEATGTDQGGISKVMTNVSTTFESNAFCIVRRPVMNNTYFGLPHEIGHIMGCEHDRAEALNEQKRGEPGIGAYSYSYGYLLPGNNYGDIMSYTPPGVSRIPYFSNPDVLYGGVPTGVPENQPASSANTALTMNNTASTVAGFRNTVFAGNVITISNSSASQINITSISPESPAPWLSVSPQGSFSINPGTSQNVTVQVDYGLAPNGYSNVRLLIVTNNASANPVLGGIAVIVDNDVSPPQLVVSPSDGLTSSGNQGASFSPATKTYAVINSSAGTLNWTASADQNWLTVEPASGQNSGNVAVSINANANLLSGSPGGTTYMATVSFGGNGGSTTRQVQLTVYSTLPPQLAVSPSDGLTSSGSQGRVFNPSTKTYTLSNAGGGTLNWTVSADQNWVTAAPTSSQLPGDVLISINANANSLSGSAAGTIYTVTVSFGGNGGTTTRQVQLTVYSVPPPTARLTDASIFNAVFRFLLNGPVGSNYVIQFSSDLVNWLPMSTNTIPVGGSITISDATPASLSRRFYRAVMITGSGPIALTGPIDGNLRSEREQLGPIQR